MNTELCTRKDEELPQRGKGQTNGAERSNDNQRKGPKSFFGSSHFLFERARCFFHRSRAFLVLSCPSVHNLVL